MVEEIIFGNILRIYGTLDDHFPPHGSSVDHFNQVHEILLGFEAANELGVIWRAERQTIINNCWPYSDSLRISSSLYFWYVLICIHKIDIDYS